jgi:hypothetical protein
MTALPDPAELAPSRDPAAYGRRRVLSPGFWAMISLCVLCIMAGMAIVTFAPRLLRAHPVAPQTVTQPAALAAPEGPYVGAATAPASGAGLQPAQLGALTDRVARLEANQARSLGAASAALAASELSEAAAQPRPFVQELAAASRVLPGNLDAAALTPLAAQGAPTRAALAAQLNDIAASISVAARAPDKNAAIMAQIAYAISRVVSIRRVDPQGTGPDAALALAQRRADAGDLEDAIAALNALPARAQGPLQVWRARAARRIDIDRHVGALRATALADMAAAEASAS